MDIQLSDHFTYNKLLKFALPSIGMLTIDYLYEIADGYFIANYIGVEAFATVGFTEALLIVIMAIAFMFASGGNAIIAQTLGNKQNELAKEYFTMIISTLIVTGISISVILYIFMEDFLSFAGASEIILSEGVAFGRILVTCITFSMLNIALQNITIVAEKSELGFILAIITSLTNIILDYLFIVILQWGINGAAYATAISWVIGGILPLIYFSRSNSSQLQFRKFTFNIRKLLHICYNGSSDLITNLSLSMVIVLYNYQLIEYFGENGVAVMGIIGYMDSILYSIYNGYSMAVIPAIGYHLGAKNFTELKNILYKSWVINLTAGIIVGTLIFFFGRNLAGIFLSNDITVLEMAVQAMRIMLLGFILSGFNTLASDFFTGLGNGTVSGIIAFVRLCLLQIAGIFLLPEILGPVGLWYVLPVAEVVTLLLVIYFYIYHRHEYTK